MFVTAGGSNLLLVPWPFVVAHFDAMHLVVDVVALMLLVHDQDLFLPLVIGRGDSDPNVGNKGGIACRDPLLDSSDHDSLLSSQLGFSFELLEVNSVCVFSYLQLLHLFLMDLFNGWILELCPEFSDKVIPVRVSVSGSGGISVVVDPVYLTMMGPPVTSTFGEVGGHEDHHKRGDSLELISEHLKVGGAVSEKPLHVAMLSFEGFWGFHEDGSDPQEGGLVIYVPLSYWSLSWGNPTGWSQDGVSVRIRTIGQSPQLSPLLVSLSQVE